jgi:signal transduction histidine kinase/ActR/RegA family two-component response regulator
MKEKKFQSIGFKINGAVLGVTGIVAMAVMAVLFWVFYHAEERRVQLHIGEIEKAHIPPLTQNLWNFNFPQIRLHLEGMLSIPHVQNVALKSEGQRISFGNPSSSGAMTNLFPLVKEAVGPIGYLEIQFSRQAIRSATFRQIETVYITVLLHMALVSGLLIWIFQRKITRHLTALGDFTGKLSPENLNSSFRFNRKPARNTVDELDLLLNSIDQMRTNMAEQLEKQKSMEAQLLRTRKMEALGTLAGGVAHDLNNILSGIVTYPDLLMLKYPEGSPMRETLQVIKKSGLRAAAIVDDLLTLARRNVSVMDVVDVNQMAADYLESPEFEILKYHHPEITFHTDLKADGMIIRGSSAHLTKSLMNLVSNAAESIQGPGTVTVSTRNRHVDGENEIPGVPPGDFVMVTVTDDGSGIADEDLERIFEPFYTKKSMGRSGTGLGMAVVYGTVQDHHGHIDIQTELEEGTVISLLFPATRKEADSNDHSANSFSGRGETILVVDDVGEQREIAADILKKLDYSVKTAASGEEAVAYLKQFPADLVVLDMIMVPGMDGLDTYKAIREIRPGQRVLLVSGYSENRRVKTALGLGAGGYLRKPYLLQTIGAAVRKVLEKEAPQEFYRRAC